MKKLLAVVAALALSPLSVFAISLETLQANPDRYQVVAQTSDFTTYVDKDSIESLRYAPPYYTMRCRAYGVGYAKDFIMDFEATVNYDYSRAPASIKKQLLSQNPAMTRSELIGTEAAEFSKNNGISSNYKDFTVWSLAGERRGTISPKYDQTCKGDDNMYHIANYLFYSYYNEYFGPKYSSENLY